MKTKSKRPPYRKEWKPRLRKVIKPVEGLPDVRGWMVTPHRDPKQPQQVAKACAKVNGKWVQRVFRSMEEAKQFAAQQNAEAIRQRAEMPAPLTDDEAAPTLEKLLTSHEVAKRLRLTLCGLNALRRRSTLPCLRVARRTILYRWSEVRAWLEARRVAAVAPTDAAERAVKVEPYTSAKYKFCVRGEVNGEPVRKYFRTEEEANDCARRLNSAAGLKPFAPLPQCPRGINPDGPMWRVGPYYAAKSPHLKYRVFAKIEGKWRGHFFRTEREALAAANELNFQVTLQREMAAPAPVRAQIEPKGSALSVEEQTALAALDAPKKTPAEIEAARVVKQSTDVAALNAPAPPLARLLWRAATPDEPLTSFYTASHHNL